MKVRNKSKIVSFTEAQKKEWGITRELTALERAAIEAKEIAAEPDYSGDFESRVFGTAENPRSPFLQD